MRATPTRYPRGTRGPTEAHGLRTTLVGTAAFSTAVVVGTLAVLYPVVGVLGVGAAVAVALAARAVGRAVRRRRDGRPEARTRRVCVPATGVCVEV